MSPPRTTCFDIFSPLPGDSEVISQVRVTEFQRCEIGAGVRRRSAPGSLFRHLQNQDLSPRGGLIEGSNFNQHSHRFLDPQHRQQYRALPCAICLNLFLWVERQHVSQER